jgi:hypothetical protein
MFSKSVLPPELVKFDDDHLATARESISRLGAEDLRSLGEKILVTLPDGRKTHYAYFPNLSAASTDTLVHFQPIANGIKPQAIAQVAALRALTEHNVLFVPQNNYTFTKNERKQVLSGDYSPLAEQRLRIVEHAASLGYIALDSIKLIGYSFGATDAAATGAEITKKDAGIIRAAVFAEPANVVNRSSLALFKDFSSTKTDKFLEAVTMADLPALSELYDIRNRKIMPSTFMTQDMAKFPYEFIRYGSTITARGLRFANFAIEVSQALESTAVGSNVVIHKDLDSDLAPLSAFNEQSAEICQAADKRGINVFDIRTTAENQLGHAIGDNPWFWATLSRIALKSIGR